MLSAANSINVQKERAGVGRIPVFQAPPQNDHDADDKKGFSKLKYKGKRRNVPMPPKKAQPGNMAENGAMAGQEPGC